MLYNILIAPIEYVLRIIFFTFYTLTFNSVVVSLLGLSLTISFVTLPLYDRADEYQRLEREKQRSMEKGIALIRKAFRGDERFWVLSAYYKQQNYKYIYVFRSSLSLLLQIPFFLAAYHLLSHMTSISDSLFRTADQWLVVGAYHINVLPILMTVINLLSGIVYSCDMKWKEKWQIFVLPVVFLVILYKSPAALVIYWIFNNLFSLIKNMVIRLHKTQQAKEICLVLLYLFGLYALWSIVDAGCRSTDSLESTRSGPLVFACVCLAYHVPILGLWRAGKHGYGLGRMLGEAKGTIADVLLKGAVWTVFTGIYIPVSVIASSPVEFLQASAREVGGILHYPLQLYAGLFLIWPVILFYFVTPKYRGVFSRMLSAGILLLMYHFFCWDNHNGVLLVNLRYDRGIRYATGRILLSMLCMAVVTVLIIVVLRLLKRWERSVMGLLLAGMLAVSLFQVNGIRTTMEAAGGKASAAEERENGEESKTVYFSESGQNVLILMLDRAIGAYVPYIMDEKPELREAFDGFTYYPNTISMARCTNLASPELFGGYEYTVDRMNLRTEESIKDKHNEALKVLPVLFDEAGYQVILSDLPYANYSDTSDMSMFDEYKRMQTYNFEQIYTTGQITGRRDEIAQGQAFTEYVFFKTSPYFLQYFVYYNVNDQESKVFNRLFYASYEAMSKLKNMTGVAPGDRGCFIEIDNNLTHEPQELQLPDYTYSLEESVDNSGYDMPTFYTLEGNTMQLKNMDQIKHYHVNMAAFLKLGEWFDYLRELGVYDNTRIIIVADHGNALGQFDHLIVNDELDAEAFNCLLLYKDFNSTGWHISDEFMTNADVPTLATQEILTGAVNPFTGSPINSDRKLEGPMKVTLSINFSQNSGNVLDTSDAPWYSVHDNIFRKENWVRIED